MLLDAPGKPLRFSELPIPEPGPGQVRLRVLACGVCRTDLHIADGDLPMVKSPLVPGHQVVGLVDKLGEGKIRWSVGDRVGLPWLGYTCGQCRYCRRGQENLCEKARFTGYHQDGGYAEYTLAEANFIYPLPPDLNPVDMAPWLCAGLIGYRAYRLAGDAQRLGLYGFGSAAHLIAQVAHHEGRQVFAFTRPNDRATQQFALELGAHWAGGSDQVPPEPLDAAILFAPVGGLVPKALSAVDRGGVVVTAGIHMSDIPSFPYSLLWEERMVRSVANLTRADGEAFLALAPQVPVRAKVRVYPLEEAVQALEDMRGGRLEGSAVLRVAGA